MESRLRKSMRKSNHGVATTCWSRPTEWERGDQLKTKRAATYTRQLRQSAERPILSTSRLCGASHGQLSRHFSGRHTLTFLHISFRRFRVGYLDIFSCVSPSIISTFSHASHCLLSRHFLMRLTVYYLDIFSCVSPSIVRTFSRASHRLLARHFLVCLTVYYQDIFSCVSPSISSTFSRVSHGE
jgi:hypothetical protein